MERIHTVGAVAFDGSKALLVKHGEAAAHLTGVYGLPGGRLDPGESLLDGVAREFEEETGLIPDKFSIQKLPTVYQADLPRKDVEILKTYWNVFLIKEFTGELKAPDDETEPEWIEIDEVSKLNLLPNTENAIREGLQLLSK